MKSNLALVLSGGFVKGVAHISIAEEMCRERSSQYAGTYCAKGIKGVEYYTDRCK